MSMPLQRYEFIYSPPRKTAEKLHTGSVDFPFGRRIHTGSVPVCTLQRKWGAWRKGHKKTHTHGVGSCVPSVASGKAERRCVLWGKNLRFPFVYKGRPR